MGLGPVGVEMGVVGIQVDGLRVEIDGESEVVVEECFFGSALKLPRHSSQIRMNEIETPLTTFLTSHHSPDTNLTLTCLFLSYEFSRAFCSYPSLRLHTHSTQPNPTQVPNPPLLIPIHFIQHPYAVPLQTTQLYILFIHLFINYLLSI